MYIVVQWKAGGIKMDELITIEASKDRNNFFKLLEKVFNEEKTFLIKKSGIAVAEISRPKRVKKSGIMKFAGVWKDMDVDRLILYIDEGREDSGKLKRELPQW